MIHFPSGRLEWKSLLPSTTNLLQSFFNQKLLSANLVEATRGYYALVVMWLPLLQMMWMNHLKDEILLHMMILFDTNWELVIWHHFNMLVRTLDGECRRSTGVFPLGQCDNRHDEFALLTIDLGGKPCTAYLVNNLYKSEGKIFVVACSSSFIIKILIVYERSNVGFNCWNCVLLLFCCLTLQL